MTLDLPAIKERLAKFHAAKGRFEITPVADFIDHAPTDLAACVKEIERLTSLEVPPMKDMGRDCIWESLPGHDGDWCTAHNLSRYACQAGEIARLTEALVEERALSRFLTKKFCSGNETVVVGEYEREMARKELGL